MSNKQELTITVDVPAGYELTGEYRNPTQGENFISNWGRLGEAYGNNGDLIGRRPILRKVWQAPSWIPDGAWVYQNWGEWRVSRHIPALVTGGNYATCGVGNSTSVRELATLHNDTFTPPPVDCIQVKR